MPLSGAQVPLFNLNTNPYHTGWMDADYEVTIFMAYIEALLPHYADQLDAFEEHLNSLDRDDEDEDED